MQLALSHIGFEASTSIASDKLEAVREALMTDIDFYPGTGSDPYFAGKAFAKLARLILIADELGYAASNLLIAHLGTLYPGKPTALQTDARS
jgi:hypothetical protein